MGVLFGFFEPATEVLKGIATGNVVDEESASSAAVVAASDAAKGFLSRRVPDLELDLGVVGDGNHAGAEFDANRQIVDWLEALVCEL